MAFDQQIKEIIEQIQAKCEPSFGKLGSKLGGLLRFLFRSARIIYMLFAMVFFQCLRGMPELELGAIARATCPMSLLFLFLCLFRK